MTIIIEFNGLPSCGKTTTASLLENKLISLGYKVGNLDHPLEYIKRYNKIVNNINLFHFGLNEKFRVFSGLIRLRLSQKPIRLDNFFCVYEAYSYHYQINKLKNKNKRYDFMICDQGLIQAISSIIQSAKINNILYIKFLLNYIFNNFYDIYIINCNIDIYTAKNRTYKRYTTKLNFDSIKEDRKLLTSLAKRKNNLLVIRKFIEEIIPKQIIELDMNCSPKQNIENIVNRIFM
jgi:hypothetical protein